MTKKYNIPLILDQYRRGVSAPKIAKRLNCGASTIYRILRKNGMMNKNIKIILTEARSVLSEEARWTTDYFARDANGCPVGSSSDDAVCFCVLGAISRAAYNRDFSTVEKNEAVNFMTDVVQDDFGFHEVADFNDNERTKHEDVLKLFDKALEGL
jgi:hypothetical protein